MIFVVYRLVHLAGLSGFISWFLNIDLDLRHSGRLDDLISHLEPAFLVLNRDGNDASLELTEDQETLEETRSQRKLASGPR